MQSGISVSPALHSTFHTYLSSPDLFALLITITAERLEPLSTIPFPTASSSPPTFLSSLSALNPHLTPTQALYIILRRPSQSPSDEVTSSLIAVTYVPDTAPVRSKTLFASTRLTLIRELGAEKFSEQIFATESGDLSAEGWEKWERHGKGEAPLTREEEVLGEVKRKEGEEGRGTGVRRAHVQGDGMKVKLADGVREEVRRLVAEGGGGGLLVMLRIAQNEEIELAGVEETDVQTLAAKISDTEPRYSFFRQSSEVEGREESPIVFIYTCPSGSKVKERMVYASFKKIVMDAVSQEGGFEVTKKLEASSPSEITPEMIEEEYQPRQEQKQGFARPKRPGKR
ncbi:MAG: hypothetical protein Q9219_000858 [cf. Caloplaca sp. 3 TL-2023]